MALDYTKLKVGDKVRYLGWDIMEDGELTITEIYDIVGKDYVGRPFIKNDEGYSWHIYELNADCFELVADEADCNCDTIKVETKDGVFTTCKGGCKHDSHIVSLAKEIAKLKRELYDLMDAMQLQAHEDNERIERILDDIVMLDERTQDVSNSEPTPVRKVVYEYERYYD